ncbi:MAG: hypothetical protein JXB17_06595 [Bacteroidales bacterium]|nr:hypothetical protein [Bacteroidales bacterium]
MISGILNIKFYILFITFSFFTLLSCNCKNDYSIKYKIIHVNNEDVKYFELSYNLIKQYLFKINYITNVVDTSFLIKINNEGIYTCGSEFTNCELSHSFIDSNLILKSNFRNYFLPFFSTDTRFIGEKTYTIDRDKFKVYRFKEDVLQSSNSIKYSYYLINFGFIYYYDFYEEYYFEVNEFKGNSNYKISDIKKLINLLVNDSTFFVLPEVISPPTP